MKSLTNKEYNNYMEYKKAKDNGQILTADVLRLICNANDNNPEKIGLAILDSLNHIQAHENAQHLHL